MVVGSFLQANGWRPHGAFRLATPDNARPRGRQASLCVRVSAQETPSSTGNNRVVASILLQKEEELKAITAPGRLAPRAAVIASLRKEIAALREQLKSSVSANLPPTLAADLPLASTAGSKTASIPTRSPAMGATTAAPLPSGARSALLMVEQQLAVGSAGGAMSEAERARLVMQAVEQNMALMANNNNSTLAFGGASDPEMQALQQENALLQAQLETLVERRRHLQVLKQKLASGVLPVKSSKGDTKESMASSSSSVASSSSDEEGSGGAPKRRTRRTTKAAGVDGGEVKAPVKRRTTTAKKEGDASAPKRGRKPKAAAAVDVSVTVSGVDGGSGEIKKAPESAVTTVG